MIGLLRHTAAPRPGARRVATAVAALSGLMAVACGSPANGATGRHVAIVAAENFWGSLATQLGGTKVSVTTIVTDPNADPHDYQSSPANARAFATADYVIVNGAGYDTWAGALLGAGENGGRRVLTVADLLGRRDGDNPHFWYGPGNVTRVADQITSDLISIDAADSSYFSRQRAAFTESLKPLTDRIAAIKGRFAGRKVAATESIFQYMAEALGLDVITPPEFMKAVAEGNDPPAETVTTFQEQLQTKQATVLVYNEQTSTDVTNNLKQLATQEGIPVVGITETIQPPDTPFAAWMVGQLDALQNALGAAAAAR